MSTAQAQPAGNASGPADGLAARLRTVRIGLRNDLEASRHLFRGAPAYVLRDPLTFQSHRLTLEDYFIASRLDPAVALGEIFAELVAAGRLEPAGEERFYGFILQLHQCGLLNLPLCDDTRLYRRHQLRRAAEARQRWQAWLFLQVPLWDPSGFLDRTCAYVQPLFQPWFLAVWAVLVVVAAGVGWVRADELLRAAPQALQLTNVPLLWLLLVTLKALHELGHAYACRLLGGRVPEIGVMLILGTPCAYVDASASWGFAQRGRRIAVALAGMYVELMIAALALLVWAFVPHGGTRVVAYNVVVLASVTTLLFNANPLMRYDGYYVLCDLLGIPNLRSRAEQALRAALKRLCLGLPGASRSGDGWLRATLLLYGVGAALYKFALLLGLATVIAYLLPPAGLLLAAGFLLTALARPVVALFRYLWLAQETAPVRGRAVALGALLILLTPVALYAAPWRAALVAPGVVERELEHVIVAPEDAVLAAALIAPGDAIAAGAPLFTLHSDLAEQRRQSAAAAVEEAGLRREAAEPHQPAQAQLATVTQAVHAEALSDAEQSRRSLRIVAATDGDVLSARDAREEGSFVRRGEALATLGGGGWVFRALLDERQMSRADLRGGAPVEVRTQANPGHSLRGEIMRVEPLGSPVEAESAAARVVADEQGHELRTHDGPPRFHVLIRLQEIPVEAAGGHCRGLSGRVRLRALERESVGQALYRQVLRFIQKVELRS